MKAKYFKKTLVTFVASFTLFGCDQTALQNETEFLQSTSDAVTDIYESNATEEANRLINIARAAERWFEKNSIDPRVHD